MSDGFLVSFGSGSWNPLHRATKELNIFILQKEETICRLDVKQIVFRRALKLPIQLAQCIAASQQPSEGSRSLFKEAPAQSL